MPTGPARTADEVTDNIRSFIEEMTRRGQDVADMLADRGSDVGSLVNEAWRDTRPLRRDAADHVSSATKDAANWSDKTWRKSLRPALKDLWKQRTVALGAAGAAVPAGRELVDSAAVRLGIKQREERHWGAFFLGLLVGAAAGAIVAMLTTPKRGSEMRRELGEKADELASKAKEADWVPIFQRDDGANGFGAAGDPLAGATTNVTEGAADAGTAAGEAADQAAEDTAEAINDSYDTVDRESHA